MDEYIFDHQINEEREEFVTAQLVAFNEAHTTAYPVEPHEAQPLHLYALDTTGAIRGGLIGRTHAIPQWLEISIIWVDEQIRRQGLGRQLMEEAEREACRRGCRYARLATSNFQAPGFYERLGYSLYGKLENCPPGETAYYYWKELADFP
jgi:ribosomal protein S18 acetylase RimI-like enzyme